MATNKIHTIGRLTVDPELRETGGVSRVTFSLASDTSVKSADGSTVTNFYRVTAWRKPAEVMAQYLHKGDRVYIDGELVIQDYVGNDGTKRTSVGITVRDFEFIQTKRTEGGAQPQSATKQGHNQPNSFTAVETDDLPF